MGAALAILIIVAVLAVIILMVAFSKKARIRRALRNAQQVAISEFPEDAPAKVVGKLAYGEHTVTAPLTGRQCAFYEVIVEEYRSNGKSGSWYEVVSEIEFADFLLEDASGKAVIRMQAAEVVVVQDNHSKSGTFDDANAAEQAFLDKHGKKSQGWVFNKKLRYKEGVLEQGEAVAVLGRGSWEANPDPAAVPGSYRETSRRLVLRTQAETPLYVSDDPSTLN